MDRRKSDDRRRTTDTVEAMDVREIGRRIWRRKALTLLLFLAPVALGAAWIESRPNIYNASASIILEDPNSNVSELSQAFPTAKLDDMTIDTQAKVLSSPALVRNVVNALGLHIQGRTLAISKSSDLTAPLVTDRLPTDSVQPSDYAVMKAYEQGLTITPIAGSRVIEISFHSTDPVLAATIANAHTKEYVASAIQIRQQQNEQIKQWIESQVTKIKTQDMQKSEAIQKFQQNSGMLNGGNSTDLVYQQISDLSTQLAAVEAHKMELQAHQNSQSGTSNGTDMSVMQSPLIQSLKTQASTAHQELQVAGAAYGPNHPMYLQAQQKVAEADAALNHEIGNIMTSDKTEYAAVTNQESLLKDRLDSAKGQAELIRQKQVQLQALQLDETASSKLLDSFLAHYGEIESQLNFAHADVRIDAMADVPMEPTGPSKKLLMMIVMFMSAVFAVGAVGLISMRDTGVEMAEDVRKVLNLRLLGIMPKVRDSVQEVVGRKSSAYLEEVKRIYLHLSSKGTGGTLLVTEARHGEGKAGFTNAIASYLMSIGQRVVVLAADPANAALEPSDTGPGLAEVLAGRADVFAAVRPCDFGFPVMPIGDGPVDFSAATSIKQVFQMLKGQYDYILVDAAPVLSSTDSEALARLVDQVVIVVAQSRTSRKKLKAVAQMMRQFSADVPYALLSQANLKAARGH